MPGVEKVARILWILLRTPILFSIMLLVTGNAPGAQFAGVYVVTAPPFGAKADGVTDDTAAFASAMAAASGSGGGIVEVPAGTYQISGNIEVPSNVTLEGVSPRFAEGANPLAAGGSVLLATSGAGDANGVPFIRLNTVSVLKGLTIYYPGQTDSATPTPYPWTVRGNANADNCTLIDVTIVNAYQAVDFGTNNVGRHWIDGFAAQALSVGLYVHQCYDVGRLRDVYFGPIWTTGPAAQFMKQNGVAFRFGRTDGEQASACRATGYNTGFHFIRGPIGASTSPGSGVMKDASTTDCATSFYVEDAGDNAGWSFVGGSFEGVVSNGSNQKGEFKFYESAFQQPAGASRHAQLVLRFGLQKPFFFEHCTFGPLTGPDSVALECNAYALIVMNCTFNGSPGDVKVRLGTGVREAVVVGNTMHGGVAVQNNTTSGADVQVGLNVTGDVDPVASFTAEPLSGLIPLTVQFTDTSTPGTFPIASWIWDFGDGEGAVEQNPSHDYLSEGVYTVSVTVAGGNGVPVTFTREAYITAWSPTTDLDHDGMYDAWEAAHGVTDPDLDPDSDGLANLQESQHSTDPNDMDSDDDTYSDGDEVAAGSDPNDGASIPMDVTNPVAVCQAVDVTLGVDGTASITAQQVDNGSTDDRGIESLVLSQSTFNCANIGANTVTLTVTDTSGNMDTCDALVTVSDPDGRCIPPDTEAPVITLEGEPEMTLEAKVDTYQEPGAKALDDHDGDITELIAIEVEGEGEMNEELIGDYALTYSVSDGAGNAAMPVTRTVHVVDTTPPVIELEGESDMLLPVFESYKEPGYSASDLYDGDLTLQVEVLGTLNENAVAAYPLRYTVSDSSGNEAAPVTRLVHVYDDVLPVIQLLGEPEMTLEAKVDTYTEPGATATDTYDGDLSSAIEISGTVDVSVLGDYSVSYDAQDSSGNAAPTAIRLLHVRDTLAPVIALLGSSSVQIEVGAPYQDAGATAVDLYDGDITSGIAANSTVNTAQAGVWSVTYSVSDSSGNLATPVTRIVQMLPRTPEEGEGEGTGNDKILGCGASEPPVGENTLEVVVFLMAILLFAVAGRAHLSSTADRK